MRLPRDIKFDRDSQNNELTINIIHPEANMQTDMAAFEGWALVHKANKGTEKIILKFEPYLNDNFAFNNLDKKSQHYMRFLYRVCKFETQMKNWFHIHKDNLNTVNKFKNEFTKLSKLNNIPNGPSSFNPNGGEEHILEKLFTGFKELRDKIGVNYLLNDQLPVGIFNESITRKSRIFGTGFFDLWGVDNGTLSIFELKKPGNNKIGIISELFFYANVAHDLLSGNDGFRLNNNESNNNFRGYNTFTKSSHEKINAYFLIDSFHAEVERNVSHILTLLNSNSKIKYDVKKYQMDKSTIARYTEKLKNCQISN